MNRPMNTALVAALAFAAGAVMAVSLQLAPAVSRAEAAVAPPSIEPTMPACSADVERSYELMRFAQYSHVPWLEHALNDDGVTDDEYLNRPVDADFQRWWIDRYADVLSTLTADCVPAADYPPLADLPPGWSSYPARSSEGAGATR